MSSISLGNAWLLLIAVPLIVLIAVPFAVAVRKDNRNGHNIASCIIHVVLAVIIAFAAAGVTLETTLTETDVYVVADVSYSSNRNLSVIDGYIEDLQDNLPNNSKLGVICFGKDCEVLTKMGGKITSVKNSAVDDSQTDIVNALEYARKRFASGVIKRIVLITDALQTGENGDEELKAKIEELAASNIYVDAIFLDNNITSSDYEVQLSGVEYSQTAFKGRDTTVTASVQSAQSAYATVSLYKVEGEEESLLSSKNLTLSAGTTEVEFSLPSDRESGTYNYKIYVSSESDTSTYNNSYSFTQQVEGQAKVLFITGDSDDYTAARSIFGSMDVDLTRYYNNPDIPYTVADVCEYDIIILADVDVSTLNNYSMFIDSLEVAVSQLGKSFIAIGDLNLQNTEDEALLKLEDMLPVTYGDSVRDAKLYTLVIDCSHSMSISGKLIRAKEAAQAVIKLLNEDDYISIIKFYGDNEIVLAPQEVGDGTAASEAIENIETMQGTVISGGLNNAVSTISGLNFSSKSVLLITDGVNGSGDSSESVYTAVQNLAANGIGTSVINVGLTTEYDTTDELLNNIAAYGGGTHYKYTYGDSLDDSILPSISNELGESVVDGTTSAVSVSYKNYTDSVLDGLKEGGYLTSSSDSLSYIRGYVVTSAKSGATTALTVSYQSSGSSTSSAVPVYSHWSYGNGSTAAFTSSLSGDWVARWQETGILYTFMESVIETNIPEERVDTPYTVTVNKNNDSYSLEITPVEVKSGATVTVSVTSPEGQTSTLTNVVFDSTAYTCSFSVDTAGTYLVTVDYEYNGVTYNSYSYYACVSYLSEYNSFASYDASLLYNTVGSYGTVSEDGSLTITNDESEISKRTVNLTVPLLIVAAVLFAAEIVVRKLKWNDIVSLFKKVDKERKS